MEFMNPEERRRHNILLVVGYVLIGVAILLVTTILIYVALGYGYKNGQVIQNGLVFVSSTPNPATISIDGARYKDSTNARIVLPAGTYNFMLQRSGYRSWQRSIVVQGGVVANYDYPFLFPTELKTTSMQEYASKPALLTESPDQHWLIVARPGSLSSFDIYDLNSPAQAPTVINLAAGLFTSGAAQTISLVEWSDDNVHVLLKHSYDDKSEYILLDRSAPEQSLNLTETLGIAPQGIEVKLSNKKYDHYIVYDTTKQELLRATLSAPMPKLYIDKILAYRTYGDNTLLYATPSVARPDKVDIDLYDGSRTYTIRRDAARTTYLLDLTQYNGDLFVAIAASSENLAYIYHDPVSQITNPQLGVAVPIGALHIADPTYLSFSSSARYIVAENGATFAAYDAESQQANTYTLTASLDSPQTHAVWMDGGHLIYVSDSKLVVFDYDGANRQTLGAADPSYASYFDANYRFLYALAPVTPDKTHEQLTSTALRTPADQGGLFPR